MDTFCNEKLSSDVRQMDNKMTVTTNGGQLTAMRKGHPKNHGDVWCHLKAVTNVLCMKCNMRSLQ